MVQNPYSGGLAELLLGNPLGEMHLSGIRRAAQERFATFLPDVIDEDMLPALARFANDIPWRYVRAQTVDDALTLLERDHGRTLDALRARRDVVARGVDGLLAPSQIWSREDSPYEGSFTDATVLLLEFHPEYLRVVEHVYGNLACLYWSIVKKRGVDGRFDLPGAVAVLGDQGLSMLTVGYDDVIRNAAAHGGVQVGWPDIQYVNGGHVQEMSVRDFLHRFDDLWFTANSLALAILLYLARNPGLLPADVIPLPIAVLTATAGSTHPGMRIRGVVESDFEAVGRQLHVGMITDMQSREALLMDSGRIAANLLAQGLRGYSRLLFTVSHPGSNMSDFVVVRGERLRELLEDSAPVEQLAEAFDLESTLTWHGEAALSLKRKKWGIILRSATGQVLDQVRRNLQEQQHLLARARYVIRDTRTISTDKIARVKAVVVLRNPGDADDRRLVNAVLVEATRRLRRRMLPLATRDLTGNSLIAHWPRTVIVSLYREDGPLRWLESGGWLGGNLVAVSEQCWRAPYVQVKNPEAMIGKIRAQYSMRL